MIFFSIVESINKFLGLVIIALLSRILGIDNFVFYSSIMVIFAYFFEFSNFSFQNKNLIDASSSVNFIYSPLYIQRLFSLLVTSSISFFIFYFIWGFGNIFLILPLALILFVPFITFDFYLFANEGSKYVVISRLVGQLGVLLLIYLFGLYEIHLRNIFWINFFQSYFLSFLLICFAIFKLNFNLKALFKAAYPLPSINSILNQLKLQSKIFLLKISVLMISSIEIASSFLFNSNAFDNLVLGNRVVIILIPFIQFYINSNIKKINSNNYIRYMSINCLFVVLLVLISPTIILLLFGGEALPNTQLINAFLPLAIFQAFINYTYMTSIKKDLSQEYFKRIFFIIMFALIALAISYQFNIFDIKTLVIIVYAKCILAFLAVPNIRMQDRILTVILFIIPATVNLICVKYSYFINYLSIQDIMIIYLT